MSDEPQPEGFTFKDRRRATSESVENKEEAPSEPSFTVNDRRHAVEPQPAPAPPPPPPTSGFGFGAPPPSSAAPQAPVFGGFGGGEPSGMGFADEPQMGYGYDDAADYPQQPSELPDVRELLVESLMTMRTMAAIRLGLMPSPITGQLDVDLEQGLLAVDAVAFLVDQIEPFLPHQDRLPLRSMVSDMRQRGVELARELEA